MITALARVALLAVAMLTVAAAEAHARIVRIEILWRGPAYDGRSFGTVGAYEKIVGRAHPLHRHVAHEQRVVRRVVRDHRDARGVALVARARVRDLPERPHGHASIQASDLRTASRGTNAEVTAISSRAAFVTPPPPAGPLV